MPCLNGACLMLTLRHGSRPKLFCLLAAHTQWARKVLAPRGVERRCAQSSALTEEAPQAPLSWLPVIVAKF